MDDANLSGMIIRALFADMYVMLKLTALFLSFVPLFLENIWIGVSMSKGILEAAAVNP